LKSALKYSKIQIELVPDRSQSYYYHGKLLYEKKEYENAVIYLEKAVELNPGMRRYRLVLAKAYAGAGLIEKARETYDNFIDEPLKDLWKEEEMLKEAAPKPR
ncbi:MAG: tetratricopeptide repeat protein, partial [Candidatus Marinimicrobia bacterium]|nr:tetratricopeptide repeat protein [Candidatus Neomarinimicrobiota bacterium]